MLTDYHLPQTGVAVLLSVLVVGVLAACSNTSRQELFDEVWQTIAETYPDPRFGGVDWRAVGAEYRPRVLGAESDKVAFEHLNQMLFELGCSHTGIGFINSTEAVSPYVFASGSPGIDIRLIEDAIVVVSVQESSPADAAGIVPGETLVEINGVGLSTLLESGSMRPPDNPRNRRHTRTQHVLRQLFGESDTMLELVVRNTDGQTRRLSLSRAHRNGGRVLFEGLPEVYLERETRILDGGVGYLRFNAFQPNVPQETVSAIRELRNAPGLVLDLRGNDGGSTAALRAIARAVLKSDASPCRVHRRDGTSPLLFEGSNDAYAGPLAILVDGSSVSAAELFAACLPTGRAIIVGERTPGTVAAGELEILDGDIAFVHPVALYTNSDGTFLEGHGVIPDIEVPVTRAELLEGRDPPLEAAVRALHEQISRLKVLRTRPRVAGWP